MPLQTASAELGISQPGSVNANLVNTPALNIQPANYEGAVSTQENMQEQQYQQQLQQQTATMQAMAQLGGTALSAGIGGFTGTGGSGINSGTLMNSLFASNPSQFYTQNTLSNSGGVIYDGYGNPIGPA